MNEIYEKRTKRRITRLSINSRVLRRETFCGWYFDKEGEGG
jgi:hypothetical protein